MNEVQSVAAEKYPGVLAEPTTATDLQLPLDDLEALNSDLAVPTCKKTYCGSTYDGMGQ
jgi:hypothetical protein